ncbi:MAG: 3-hydroxybutyryl-CoA dehydrogenase, partial [Planctomycetota bacterium]
MSFRTKIQTVGVLGAGQMGSGIAQTFARSGRDVLLFDAAEGAVERARGVIAKSLDKFAGKGKISADDAAAAKARIKPASINDMSGVDLVVEAIIEDVAAKRALFQQLDSVVAKDVIFASNTSSISISELGEASGRPTQFIGMHFFNPVPLMSLVEVVRGLKTDDAVVEHIVALAKELGKEPHCVKD